MPEDDPRAQIADALARIEAATAREAETIAALSVALHELLGRPSEVHRPALQLLKGGKSG